MRRHNKDNAMTMLHRRHDKSNSLQIDIDLNTSVISAMEPAILE